MILIRNMSIRAKLLGAFAVVCAVLACVSGYTLYQLGVSNNRTTTMFKENLVPIAELGSVKEGFTDLRRAVANLFAINDVRSIETTEKTLAEAKDGFSTRYLGTVAAMVNTAEEQVIFAEIKELAPQYFETMTKVLKQYRDGATDEAKQSWLASRELSLKVDGLFSKEIDLNTGFAEASAKRIDEAYHSTFNSACALIISISALSILLGWFISRWVTKAVLEVASIADDVASASQQLAGAAAELSSGAQEQASSLEETASSLEEITSTIQQNADNAQQANQLAGSSRKVAEEGGEVVSRAVQGMGEINTASKRIADIITAIDEIAFQTNLLALNAAVEAARAGEQGRGFAVVAGEVRNLAQRSAGAAKEIKSLIQDSVGKVQSGSELVNESGRTLGDIVVSVKRVTDIVSEIAAASREQASGIDQVNRAVTQMDQVVQTNAAQTEELSATAEQLSDRALQLQSVVAQFNLTRNTSSSSFDTKRAPRVKRQSMVINTPKPGRPAPARSIVSSDAIEQEVERELELLTSASGGKDAFQTF